MFHAFITQGGVEQLVNCFNEAAEGICIFFDKRFWNSSSTASFQLLKGLAVKTVKIHFFKHIR